MSVMHLLLELIGIASLILAASYAIVALVAVLVWRTRRAPTDRLRLQPVTVLKPLCGAEPGLYEHLRSFCRQDHPDFQIVFGVLDPADPALAVVAQLRAEFPSLPIDLVVNPQQHGSNRKVSNLINMMARARHAVLAIADSDTFVGPDYLSSVTLPLQDPGLGLVTCLYRGVPTRRICSRLGAMYINDWYIPAVLVAWLFGFRGYVSGQTMCLRRETLQAIGGLPAIANHLAEDYRLGELIRGLGMRIELSPYALSAQHDEPSLDSLTRHELRWMRTLRVLRRGSFPFLCITFSLPLAVFGLLLTGPEPGLSAVGWGLFLAAVMARLALPLASPGAGPRLRELWLVPARDLLMCWTWARSFFTRRVTWRGHEFDVGADGVMRALSEG
jgi:ceramide glucosyltransferase